MTPRSWTRHEHDLPIEQCPPHLPVPGGRPWCLKTAPVGYVCTRADGHTGRHLAGVTGYVVAVWE